ncbi:MAG: hypothetical protein J0652_09125 [Desulfobulbaceae bacterium]|nr:hypothetical protein [Desulfobulbaceae bacterium]
MKMDLSGQTRRNALDCLYFEYLEDLVCFGNTVILAGNVCRIVFPVIEKGK